MPRGLLGGNALDCYCRGSINRVGAETAVSATLENLCCIELVDGGYPTKGRERGRGALMENEEEVSLFFSFSVSRRAVWCCLGSSFCVWESRCLLQGGIPAQCFPFPVLSFFFLVCLCVFLRSVMCGGEVNSVGGGFVCSCVAASVCSRLCSSSALIAFPDCWYTKGCACACWHWLRSERQELERSPLALCGVQGASSPPLPCERMELGWFR